MKKLMFLLIFVGIVVTTSSAKVRDIVYTTRYDTLDLYMTIYEPIKLKFDYVILYMHGGGFMSGSRNDSIVVAYCRIMSERGFRVATIDYRLGMKSFTLKGMKFVKAIQNAIYMAVEDCSAAVVYLIKEEGVDADKVILATGGKSYPLTGSTGDGYNIAQNLGHTITTIKPSLVPLEVYEKEECKKIQLK